MTDQKRMAVLKKVIDKGFDDEKKVVSITAEQMITFCRSIDEISNIVELQKAIKANRLIPFLAGKDISKGKDTQTNE